MHILPFKVFTKTLEYVVMYAGFVTLQLLVTITKYPVKMIQVAFVVFFVPIAASEWRS